MKQEIHENKKHSNQMGVCSTNYMKKTLSYFNMREVERWFNHFSAVDIAVKDIISNNLNEFIDNNNVIPENILEKISAKLTESEVSTEWSVANLEAFHGYTVYAFPDNGKKRIESNNPDLYYGLAKATSYGVTHKHHLSNAYNLTLAGKGVFCGDSDDVKVFEKTYHGTPLTAGVELEIPIGMTHGHLVEKGHSLWFLFVQECGFKENLRCAGDFDIIENYDIGQFGKQYN